MRLQLTCALVAITVTSSSIGAQKFSSRALADKVLTLGDVAEVTKVRGLRTVEKDPRTVASGDLNIADASGEVLLMLTVSPASEFALLKRTAAARVEGVGDEAYEAPNKQAAGGMAPYMLILRKGDFTAMLVSTFTATGAPRVPQAQLKQLGQIVASRLVPTASMPATAARTPLDPKKALTPLDPQKAVTLADVQTLLGGKFAPRIVEPGIVKYEELGGPRVVEVSFLIVTPDRSLAGVKETATGHGEPIEDVPGLGDFAIYRPQGVVAMVEKKNKAGDRQWIEVRVHNVEGANSAAVTKRFAIELARRAAARP
ncbi:MAG TPA: hypothetical protein VII68_06595 [Casimicrobiaceae bacterium]|jgi:hypothetical protein